MQLFGMLASDIRTTTQMQYFLWHGMTFATGDILTFVSIVILAYTAIQALKTRKATAQAAILTVLPILFVEFEVITSEAGTETIKMRLKNVGSGPAFSIRIDDVIMDFLDVNDRWRLKLNLRPDHLEAVDSRLLGQKVLNKSGDETDVAPFMTSVIRRRKKPVTMIVYFKDVTGKRYVTVVEAGKGFARIKQPSMHYGLFRKCKYQVWYPIIGTIGRSITFVRRRYVMKYNPTLATKLTGNPKKKS